MFLDHVRNLLQRALADARFIPAVGFLGAALLVTGILFLVLGGPMQPPAAGSGGVAPSLSDGDDGWTNTAAFVFLSLGTIAGLGWTAGYAIPRLRNR